MRNIKKDGDYYVDMWNDSTGKTNASKLNVTHAAVCQMVDMLHVVLQKLDTKIDEQKQAIGTCVECGLKKKYWDEMFCGAGGEHKE